MAYDAPNATSIKARFTEFAAIADETIDVYIAEAGRWLDESWLEGDYTNAYQFLVGHMMLSEGLGASNSITPTTGAIKSEKLGDASTTWADRDAGGGLSGLDKELATTIYGKRFLELRNVSHPSVLVV